MANNVTVAWTPNPPEEQISQYDVFVDGTQVAQTPNPTVDLELAPGIHTVEVAAENVWGVGPKSDPIKTPPAPSKPSGINITITVNVTVNP